MPGAPSSFLFLKWVVVSEILMFNLDLAIGSPWINFVSRLVFQRFTWFGAHPCEVWERPGRWTEIPRD